MNLYFLSRESSAGDVVFTILLALVFAGLSVLLVFSIIKEIKKVKEEREQPTTNGLVSKRGLENTLDDFIRVYRLSKEATLITFELSNASEIADSFGKKNEILIKNKAITNIVKILPKNAIFSEYQADSDSYLILLRGNISQTNISRFCDYLVDTIEKPITIPHLGIDISYSCYMGLATYPVNAITTRDLIEKAELALYMNQKNPNRRYQVYESSFGATEKENLVYYNEVKLAIKNKEFTLYYQPICDFENGKIMGFETLIRWQHPTLGVLQPSKFLSVLENSGDIIWVGKWSIGCICLFYTANAELFQKNNVFFSINLSVKQLLNENIVSDFTSILNRNKIPTSAICIEIEEYTLYEKYSSIVKTINEFIAKGFKVAIDNFGLDFSNIKKIENENLYMIKINGNDIKDIDNSFVSQKVYDVLVQTCKEKDTKICSLRIEDRNDVDLLSKKDVSLFQGYFISAPMNDEDTVNFIKEDNWKDKE